MTDEPSMTFWEELIRENTAADFCGLTVRTMQSLRQNGKGPAYIQLSARAIRYRRRDLAAWANERTRTITGTAASS